MPRFHYVARDIAGKSVKAEEFALSEYELKMRLERKNLVIISIQEAGGTSKGSFLKKRIGTTDLTLFCKQLSTMIKGGVPIIRAIDSISSEMKNVVFQDALKEVNYYIKSGESFSASLKKFPRLFSTLFCSMAEAGERVGSLDVMLDRLSSYLQARDRLTKKVIMAMTYPAFIITFFIVAMTAITIFFIPRFRGIYEGFHAKLPPLTAVVFAISDFTVKNMPFILVALILLGFAVFQYFFKSKKGRYEFDKMTMKLPLFGTFVKNAALSKFTRTLATLMNQGIPIAESLELVGGTSGNAIIEEASFKVKTLIMDGENIPEALRKTTIFPPLMIQMVSVGVESGNLPELLDKTADFYEDRVDAFVTTLTTLIEPILLVSLGIVLGVVITALYLPIFNISQAMSGGG